MSNERLSLEELGAEYEKCAELQRGIIESCRRDLALAKQEGDYLAQADLKYKLNRLYEIRRELLDTAEKLKNYYKDGDCCD